MWPETRSRAIGRAIDAGVTREDTGALVGWAAVLLALGAGSAVAGVCRHRFSTTNYLTAAYRTVQVTARHAARLGAVLHGRTVVAIAHRLSTAHDADRVAVVSGGRVTELGTHDDLVAAGGEYAALWASWHGGGTRLR